MHLRVRDRGQASTFADIGSSGFPRWSCHPCNAARKAIQWAAKTKEAKAAVSALKAKDRVREWKVAVRGCRVTSSGVGPLGTVGCKDNVERGRRIAEFLASVTDYACVEQTSVVKWFTEDYCVGSLALDRHPPVEACGQ